jgi:formylmethanofuran dehydrogenase subunit E
MNTEKQINEKTGRRMIVGPAPKSPCSKCGKMLHIQQLRLKKGKFLCVPCTKVE